MQDISGKTHFKCYLYIFVEMFCYCYYQDLLPFCAERIKMLTLPVEFCFLHVFMFLHSVLHCTEVN